MWWWRVDNEQSLLFVVDSEAHTYILSSGKTSYIYCLYIWEPTSRLALDLRNLSPVVVWEPNLNCGQSMEPGKPEESLWTNSCLYQWISQSSDKSQAKRDSSKIDNYYWSFAMMITSAAISTAAAKLTNFLAGLDKCAILLLCWFARIGSDRHIFASSNCDGWCWRGMCTSKLSSNTWLKIKPLSSNRILSIGHSWRDIFVWPCVC